MNIALHCREAARHCGSAARRSSFVVAAVAALAAAPASATWTVTGGLNADGTTTDNFYATDGTWDLWLSRSGNGGYYCRNRSGTGGAVLDLTTFAEDMADAGVTWNSSAHYPITIIGIYNEGFMGLSGLKEVKLPSTIKTLSNQCFRGTGLEGEFIVPDTVTSMGDNVFTSCPSLTRIVMSESITAPQNTFCYCTALVEVKLASETTTLSGSPFRGCSSLTTVYANDEDRVVGSVVLPASVTTINSYTFCDDVLIERIVAPGVTSVGERAFQNCTSLSEVVLPALQQFSSTYAFTGCPLLQRIEVPNCVKLGQATFQGCSTLEEVFVSPALNALGTDCFRDCTSFRTLYTNAATKVVGYVQLPATCTGTIGNYTFYRTKIKRIDAPGITSISGQRAFESCAELVEAHLPSLTSMAGTYAFYSCPLLTAVEVSPNLTGTIGDCNFSGCNSLESVYQAGTQPVVGLFDIPAGATKLGWGCFWNCKAMERFVGPGVVDIQNRAFRECVLLRTVRFSPNLSVIHNNNNNSDQTAFYGCTSLTDFYPSTMPKITEIRGGLFRDRSALTNAFDFSGSTAAYPSGGGASYLFSGAKKVPCVKLPATFTKLEDRAFYGMAPGAEIHFVGGVPSTSGSYQLWQGQNGAGYRYKIFVDAETYPGWKTSAGTFTPVTEAMKSESDYPGIATLGYINYASNNQNNWLVQEPFYVDVTFYDEDGRTVLGVEKTLLGTAPAWTNAAPAKASGAQFDYEFAGWSTDGSTVIDLADYTANAPMSFRAVYAPVLRSYEIEWQWFDGTATQSGSTTVAYGETPAHAAVERAPTAAYTYTFLGWSTDGSTVLSPLPAVTGPAAYVAVFEEKDASTTVTVRWLDSDGTTLLGTTWPESGTAAVAPLVPTREPTVSTAYAFAGWSTDGENVLASLAVSADTDFIAVYTPSVRRYTVSFVDWNGAAIASADYDYGTAAANVALPANPTRAADAGATYAFAAWSPAIADVTGDATYTATYAATPKTYAATFVDWDGSVLAGPTDYAVGAAVAAPDDPEREGHTFAGWSPSVGAMPAAATTYAATYTLNKYRVTFANGDGTTTAKYDYGTPAASISFPTGSKTSTSKFYYRFVEWTPAKETVQSNTTYTARFTALVARPMTLALVDAAPGADPTDATVVATLAGRTASGPDPVPGAVAARFYPRGDEGEPFDGEASLTGATVTAAYFELDAGAGYDWTVTATQDWPDYGTADVAVLRGRSYAKRRVAWFGAEDVEWTDGAFRPRSASGAKQQVRVKSAFSVPEVAPASLPDAAGRITGIGVRSLGGAPSWYGWNGEAWVRLVGATPPCGGTAQILTVVDFVAQTPTATWYADGLPLTTEDGEWAIPLAGGERLTSFETVFGTFGGISSLSADCDAGAPATMVLIK